MLLTGLPFIWKTCCSNKATITDTRILAPAITTIKTRSRSPGFLKRARHAGPATMASTARGMRGNRMAGTKPPTVVL
ncbi:hypothetical protein D3C78_1183140 [compost metagenome]